MNSVDTVVHEYAIALHSLANEEDKDFIKDIQSIFLSFKENEDIIYIIASQNLSKTERKKIIDKIFDDELNIYLKNFMYLLVDNNFFINILSIIKDFFKIFNESKQVLHVKIHSPFEIEKNQLEKIVSVITKKTDKEVVYDLVIDPKLIGGIKITYDNNMLDYSIKGKIKSLKERMININKEGGN